LLVTLAKEKKTGFAINEKSLFHTGCKHFIMQHIFLCFPGMVHQWRRHIPSGRIKDFQFPEWGNLTHLRATSLAVLLSRSSAITILDFLQGSFANVESATALEFVGRLVGDQFFSRIHKRHAYSTHTHTNFFLLGATCQSKAG
jgi:hypothetical protein